MSLFRQTAKWSLRALLIWGAIEAGVWAYSEGAEHAGALYQLTGQRAAMARLTERAQASERAAAASEAMLQAANGEAWTLPVATDEPLPGAAARALREELMALGAEAPVVDASEGTAHAGVSRLTLTARWREPAETSPRVLHELAQRYPAFRVERLELERADRISTELVVSVDVRAALRQEASR